MKKIFNILFSLLMIALAVYTFTHDHSGIGYAILVFTAPGGVGIPFAFNLPYLPEHIVWNDGGNPLTNLRVETTEDGVLHNWTAANIAAQRGFMNVGALAANDQRMIIADGQINGKQTTISGTTSAVGAIPIFVNSDNLGVSAFKSTSTNVLPLSDTSFDKFSALFLPFLVTLNDRVQIFYNDGATVVWDAVELQNQSVMWQDAPSVQVNNLAGNIARVIVTSTLGGTAYILKVNV